MALVEVKVPQLSESVSEALLGKWKKSVGETVTQDEILVEIETDKVVLEVPAPVSGVLVEVKLIKTDADNTVHSDEVIAKIDDAAGTEGAATSGASVSTTKKETAADSSKKETTTSAASATRPSSSPSPVAAGATHPATSSIASPAAAKILADQGVTPETVSGTGRGGRITKQDALQAVKVPAPAATSVSAHAPVASPSMTSSSLSLEGRPEQRVPMSRLRARIAERLLQSQQQNAILTTFNEVNMQAIITLRNKYKEKFEKEHGVKLGFMSFFVKAAVAALKKYPVLNASVDGKDIIYHGYFDIGIAVGSPRGLVVPILRNADQLSIAEVEKCIVDFGKRAADGKLGLEEITGGTFSISNGGVFGSMLSTPIINPPQSAILGIHATKDRPVVENGQIVIRPMNYLALSYDHRIIDGREAVLSLVAIKEALEDPQRLLLEL